MSKLNGPRPILAGLTVFAVCAAAYVALGFNRTESQVRGNRVATARKPHATSIVREKPNGSKRSRTKASTAKNPRRERVRVVGKDYKRRPPRRKAPKPIKKTKPPPSA